MPLRRRILSLALLVFLVIPAFHGLKATHIVGAELTYRCLNVSTNSYRISLRMLRDCLTGEAEFDDVVYLYAFSTANPSISRVYDMLLPANTPEIVPTQWSTCVGTPYNLCVEEAIYTIDITIEPVVGGWDFASARCCRNASIDNLFQPLNQGVSFLAHMPGPEHAICNSMPTFNNSLPTFICADEEFVFDHSATDIDGDSLVYALSRPYTGLNIFSQGAGNPTFGGPQPTVGPQNPMGPPPYAFVSYNGASFSAADPFGPNSATIDPQTGTLTFHPPGIGVYVIAVSVFEYRNGVLLSENKKDLQIHVIQCLPQNSPPLISHTFQPTDVVVGDTIYVQANDSACYQVQVTDPDGGLLTVVPVSAIFSGPNPPSLSVTGTNPVLVDICWESSCDYVGGLVSMVLMAYDQNNCPIYNPAFDTVYVRILPPPQGFPLLDHNLPPNNPTGPDTLVLDVNVNSCIPFLLRDTSLLGGQQAHSVVVEDISGGLGFPVATTATVLSPDSLAISVCFTTACNNINKLYRIIARGSLLGECGFEGTAADTVFVLVLAPPNPAPVVNADLSQVPDHLGDTIFVDVHDNACFTFSVQDTFPGISLSQNVIFQSMTGATTGLPPDVSIISSTDSLLVQVCWVPVCSNVDGLFRMILQGTQLNTCGLTASDFDTVYIRVREATNPPPDFVVEPQPGFDLAGDTLLLPPDSLGCFNFVLSDTGLNSYLDVKVIAHALGVVQPGINVSINYISRTSDSLTGSVCIVPGCFFANELIMLEFIGRDTFDCNPSNWVHDTTYIRVVLPFNNPPVISHQLGGLPAQGNVVTVTPQAEPFCYTVLLDDPDALYADLTADAVSHVFDSWFRYGNPGEISVSGTNPLQIQVCWAPSCYDSGQRFELVVCGRDTSRCGFTPQVCDTVVFEIGECNIEVQNVFTPNGDGINDEFIPFNMEGVEFYRLNIFDRWGREVYAGQDARWNGKLHGTGADVPEGVFYFIFEYRLFSARGVPLKERSVGYLTLLR